MENKQSKFVGFLENLTILMIILVMIQMFSEDYAIYFNLNIDIIKKIKLSAIIFDLFFTIEFLVRFISALTKKKASYYFFYQNGWVDLISSIPLLLLISFPEFLYQVFQINITSLGFFNSIQEVKIVKAIRIVRILRLMRVLKIFGKIKNVNSHMAQRHLAKISTMVITSMIIIFSIITIVHDNDHLNSINKKITANEEKIVSFYSSVLKNAKTMNISNFIKQNEKQFENIGLIKYNYVNIYISKHYYDATFIYYLRNPAIQNYIKTYDINLLPDKFSITFTRDSLIREEAYNNMINFILIVSILLVLLILYSKHFAQTVSDPIYVMRMGFENREYTYAVKIPDKYKDDDVFILGSDFNNRWLPAKLRKLSETQNIPQSKLSINDILKK